MPNYINEISIRNHPNLTPIRISLSENKSDPTGTFYIRQGGYREEKPASRIKLTVDDLAEIEAALERLYTGK